MNIPADASHQPSAELRVAHLVDHYISHYKAHDPMVAKIFATEDSRKTFDRSLNHDLGILRRRSNKLDDNEISIVQKVFMILSDQGYSKAASSIYLREILGLGPGDGSDNNTIKGIQAHVSSAHGITPLECTVLCECLILQWSSCEPNKFQSIRGERRHGNILG